MCLALADRLGPRYGLTAFSLHPGVIATNLVENFDFAVALPEMSRSLIFISLYKHVFLVMDTD
jgi:NAD(P)-dependent dehydrogenase (short-subunit alcohol dehydrogenase family)